MTKSKRKRMMRYRQKYLNRMFACMLVMNIIVVLAITLAALIRTSQNNKTDGGMYIPVYESIDHNTVIPPATVLPVK